MRHKKYLNYFATIALLAVFGIAASAQTGQLRGSVKIKQADGKITPAAGAIVDVYRTDLKAKYETKADKNGNWVFAGLPFTGTYVVAASAPDAAPQVVPNVKAGREIDYAIELDPGNGKRLTEDEARGSGASTAAATNSGGGGGEASSEDKKKREELEKKNAEILAKNKQIEQSNTVVTASVKAGNEALAAKNFDVAITEYDKGITADPTHPGAPVLLTNKSVALTNRGVNAYNKGIQSTDDAEKTRNVEAAKKDWKDAAASSEQAVKLLNETTAPTDPAQLQNYNLSKKLALGARAEAMKFVVSKVDQSQADAGIVAFDEYIAVEQDPAKKQKASIDEAQMLLDGGAADKAYGAYTKILETNPDDIDAMLGAGLALFQSGDKAKFQEAANYLQRFVDKAPDTHKLKPSAKEALDYLKSAENIKPQKTAPATKRRG